MKQLSVISGKGGTGKTSIVASFAALARDKVLADCDVDAADLHLVLAPELQEEEPFVGSKQACIEALECTGCGRCLELCRFDAVHAPPPGGRAFEVDAMACEGCLVCQHFCPAGAITDVEVTVGTVAVSSTRLGPLVHARLHPGRENSGKLVTEVRRRAGDLARTSGKDLIIIDGSPGIGCPVIASITGVSYVLIVTEPTLSGLHDLERVAELAANFQLPAGVCINKFDINLDVASQVADRASELGLDVLGRITYDRVFFEAQMQGVSVVEHSAGSSATSAAEVRDLWSAVEDALATTEKESL